MIKTVTLTGSEVKVTDLGGQNVVVKNLGAGTVYASAFPNVSAGADNVVEIPSGAGEIVLDAHGTVYIVGTGKVQCTGTQYSTVNFRLPSTSTSGGGGGTSDVTKAYVDTQDTTNLSLAKSYTDNQLSYVKDDISELETNKADAVHNHDDRYYTETETDTKLSEKIDGLLKGSANGVAELDANGKVPISQLPSYVDDVIEFSSLSDFPTAGETGKIYLDTGTNLTYRWSGSEYVEISPSIALGETSSTAYRGDRGKTAYEHSQSPHAPITAQENVIETVKVNGAAVTPNSKEVDITVPTKTSELINDAGFITSGGGGSGVTYTLTKTGSTIYLNGSDGSETSVEDSGIVYSLATSTTNGLMSSDDKANLDTHIADNDKHITSDERTTWNGKADKKAATQTKDGMMSATDKKKLDNIDEKANKYTLPVATSSILGGVKLGYSTNGKNYQVRSSNAGLYVTVPWKDTNTTYTNFVKSGSGAKSGLVPAPPTTAGTTKYLCEDGTWTVPPNTTYSAATTSTEGLMSSSDKSKLDGIAVGANNYVHPTNAGNKHIPSGGSKFSALKWSADGTAVWGTYSNLTVLSITSLHGFENGQEITATRGLDRTKCLLIVYHRLTGATDYSQINHFYYTELNETTGTDYSYVFNTESSRFKYKVDGSGNLVFLAESGDNSDVNVFVLWFN